MLKILATLSAIIILTGCSTIPKATRLTQAQLKISQTTSIAKPDQDALINDAVQKDYEEAYAYCITTRDDKLNKISGRTNASVGIAAAGIIAGSVIVPTLAAKAAASKAAIAGWGGISGAANAAQYMLDNNGLSVFQETATYNKMVDDIRAAVTKYNTSNTIPEKTAALSDLLLACQFPKAPDVKQPVQENH